MVDQTAPAATENQQQNGSPAAGAAPPANPVSPLSAGTPSAEPAAAPPWSYPAPEEPAGASRSKLLGGVGGALLLAAGIGGLIFARRRRRASRREQAMQAARESAISAVARAGSMRGVARVRRGLARLIAGSAALESAVDQNAKRAGRMAKQARKKMPR